MKINKIASKHTEVVWNYPKAVGIFQKEKEKFEDYFPDYYGYAFFNYFEAMFNALCSFDSGLFMDHIKGFYCLQVFAENELRRSLIYKDYDDIYKGKIILKPLEFFLELCGMAYVVMELLKEQDKQNALIQEMSMMFGSSKEILERLKFVSNFANDIISNGSFGFQIQTKLQHLITEHENYPFKYQDGLKGQIYKVEKGERIVQMVRPFSVGAELNGCAIFLNYCIPELFEEEAVNVQKS